MNNKLSTIYSFLIVITVFIACSEPAKKNDKTNTTANYFFSPGANEKYSTVDTKQSVITWKGSMLMGANSHTGYVYLSKGKLSVDNGQITGGVVEVNMNTIEDESHERSNGLVDHLKDADFFDVKKFPVSTIAITKVASIDQLNKNVTGDLTIKGITHPVTFPAKIEIKDGSVHANGKLVIDRTKWNVRYQSRKFYNLVADKSMSDSIEFTIKLVAKKESS